MIERIAGPAFSAYPWPLDRDSSGNLGELDPVFPSTLFAWDSKSRALGADRLQETDPEHTYIGLALKPALLHCEGITGVIPLDEGMYFSVPGRFNITGGRGIAIRREGWRGMLSIGGPLEYQGRLKYIDGCTDSLLISPVKLGDPCLNLLYFPAAIDQTAHTHPSARIGVVVSGRGMCVYDPGGYADPNPNANAHVELTPGMIFCIHTNGRHKFATPFGEHMRVVAYHPDSDYGPTDEEHPMLNRTIVGGISAKHLPDIRTL